MVAWARHLVAAVRAFNPKALILVPGTDWAFNLRDCISPELTGVVYSTHVYVHNGGGNYRKWGQTFGDFADLVPVFAGEFGGCDTDSYWGEQLLNYFDEQNIGWTAWDWTNHPPLSKLSPVGASVPTSFGWVVKSCLTSTDTLLSNAKLRSILGTNGG